MYKKCVQYLTLYQTHNDMGGSSPTMNVNMNILK